MNGSAKTKVFEIAYVIIRFRGLVWTVENAMKTLVWMQIFLCVFDKMKTEVFENALVWVMPGSFMRVFTATDSETSLTRVLESITFLSALERLGCISVA